MKFLSLGHNVTGLDIESSTIDDGRYTHVVTDISVSELPEIDDAEILINNAGVQDSGRDIDVNLKGTIKVTEKYAFAKSVKSVLFVASASASTGSEFPEYVASKGGVVSYMKNVAEFPEYVASKGGVVSYMKNVALRLAERGATANSISPGGVLTPLNARVMNDGEKWSRIMELTPLRKWASADEIAEWAYFLTAVNKSMTAQDLIIDNGEAAKAEFVW